MEIKNRSRIIVFILSVLVWFALTDIKDPQEIIVGLMAAVLVALVAGHFLITTEKTRGLVKRILSAVIYFFKFIWEMIKANVHVAYIVINPNLPIKPGIVKIHTHLKKDSSITVLANSITLTPGTLTVDVDENTKDLYVHWIDVESTNSGTATQKIGKKFESRIAEVFE